MRKLVAIGGSILFFCLIFSMYLVLDQFSREFEEDELIKKTKHTSQSIGKMEQAIQNLEERMSDSKNVMNKFAVTVEKDHEKVVVKPDRRDDTVIMNHPKNVRPAKKQTHRNNNMCKFSDAPSGNSADVKMLDVYDELPFVNPDGGVWKQGWDVKYKDDAFDKNELLIFVVPHSHNDPGMFCCGKSKGQRTSGQRRRKFIWAETSYFSMWWKDADEKRKRQAKSLINNGQLEIVTGGWVMNDEANTHYYAMIDQLLEGHQWLETHIGVKPSHGWAIDPFGHTPTMAYILKRADFKGMLIQRTHYAVKRYLAKRRDLEFMWRQNWDKGSSTDMFCHMMPFYSYDVPHTCGPDPKVCCQFDFRRLPGGGMFCPWMVAPVEIGDHNVAERATTLLDQYRKKAQLYKNNIVLAPLGDDFRYDVKFEVDKQFYNYQRLIDYVNTHPELKAKMQFGTLGDYFNAIWKRTGAKPGEKPNGHVSLGGDFFTYADRQVLIFCLSNLMFEILHNANEFKDDHYWSGYYTSRSFYKHMDRVLEAYHRAAEIIFTLAHAHVKADRPGRDWSNNLFIRLVQIRADLGLFQHHDGITGTAKDHVVIDYGERLLKAIRSSQLVIEKAAHVLLSRGKPKLNDAAPFHFIDTRMGQGDIPINELVIVSNQPRTVAVYNSLTKTRKQVVTFHVSEPLVQVEDDKGTVVDCQTSVIWSRQQRPNFKKYELTFVATTPALGISTYKIKRSKSVSAAQIEYMNGDLPNNIDPVFGLKKGKVDDIVLRNHYLEAVFDTGVGLLKTVALASNKDERIKMEVKYMTYGTRNQMDKSGAYLFLPDGAANEITVSNPLVIVTRGKVYSEVRVQLQYATAISRIYHVDVDEAQAIEIKNLVDIRESFNTELIMRVESGINNVDKEFFTDLNGFQMQRRKTLDKLPMQANFYPLPATAFLQDTRRRLSILTAQSNGVASLSKGAIEVVLDRRLFQDDNRGLGQESKANPNSIPITKQHRLASKAAASAIPDDNTIWHFGHRHISAFIPRIAFDLAM
eukprot:gene3716-14989_t